MKLTSSQSRKGQGVTYAEEVEAQILLKRVNSCSTYSFLCTKDATISLFTARPCHAAFDILIREMKKVPPSWQSSVFTPVLEVHTPYTMALVHAQFPVPTHSLMNVRSLRATSEQIITIDDHRAPTLLLPMLPWSAQLALLSSYNRWRIRI